MEKVHFSFTNAGECLSLAAAKACLNKIRFENIPDWLAHLGKTYLHSIGTGHPAWKHIQTDKRFPEIMHQNGILCLGTVNLSYAHTPDDMFALQKAIEQWGVAECEPEGFRIR